MMAPPEPLPRVLSVVSDVLMHRAFLHVLCAEGGVPANSAVMRRRHSTVYPSSACPMYWQVGGKLERRKKEVRAMTG